MNDLKIKKQTSFRKWLPLIVLSFALTIIILDTTILNVSLRTIIHDLHTNIQSIQWVITVYALMLGALTITGGRLGDIFGRKKMFVLGAIIFAIGSFITSISQSVGFMIVGEAVIEGVGAALMIPATTSLLVTNYEGRDRQIGFGIWGGIAAGAAALGPVVGGWLTTYFSWRWAFRINVVVALILVIGSIFIQEAENTLENPYIDFGGIVLSVLGLLAVVFGFIEASTYGWLKATIPFVIFGKTLDLGGFSIVPFSILIGIIILTIFIFWEKFIERQNKTPLLSLGLFKNKQFTLSASITAILSLGQAGLSFAIPIFLQAVKGLSAFDTGLAMLPLSLALLVASRLQHMSVNILPQKGLSRLDFCLMDLGFSYLAKAFLLPPVLGRSVRALFFFGIGTGIMISQATNMTLSAVSVKESGEASGVNSTLRFIGQTLGSAILGAILLSLLTTNLAKSVQSDTTIPASIRPAINRMVSTQSSSIAFGNGISLAQGSIPASLGKEIISLSHQATADADKSTLLYGLIFILAAFLLSTKLPNNKNVERKESVVPAH